MKFLALIPLLSVLLAAAPAPAQTLEGQALLDVLRGGGNVIVMRHASSPRQPPDETAADPENVNRERQLDEAGRAAALAMGEALRRHGIPISVAGSSPTYRARQTALLMGLVAFRNYEELGNEGMSDAGEERGAWLREQTRSAPVGGNKLLITHAPNMNAAFGEQAAGMGEGDALVFRPERGEAVLVGRIAIGEWAGL